MNRFLQSVPVLFLSLLLMTPAGFAQDVEPATPAEAGEAEPAADQEVEINEDNYRQFMELKDAMRQRTVLPENAYQSQAGLQKLDKLPESSQKHLRNQLREVIVEGEAWQPGDEDREYPFEPSSAAATDPALRKQETEAWGELVDGYHAREADIYANASRSRAAAAAGSFGAGNSSQQGKPQAGEGPGGDAHESSGKMGESTGQQQTGQAGRQGGYSPGAQGNPGDSGESGSEGVSQNALEFLKQQGNLGQSGQTPDGQTQGLPGGQSANPSAGQAGQQANAQNQGQQPPGSEQGRTTQPSDSQQEDAGQANSDPAQQLAEQGTEQGAEMPQSAQQAGESAQQDEQDGTEAMQQTSAQAENQQQTENDASFQVGTPDSDEDSTEGVSQNALEFLLQQNGQDQEAVDNGEPQSGTLTIQDLINARGTSIEAGFGAEVDGDTDKKDPGEEPARKDDGG